MENKRVEAWMEDSRRWLELSKSAEANKFYDKELYCLEMARGSAIKALFTGLDIEFPKTHNIIHLIMINK